MPYLDAVVHEALRLHPAVGLLMERVVPAGGRTIGGRYFAAGTIVGMSPWITHYDRSVYGEDVDQWRPERWLEATDEQRKMMDRTFLAFGAGTRSCIGKNVSKLEMYKLVPHMIRTFDVGAHLGRARRVHMRRMWIVHRRDVLTRVDGASVSRPRVENQQRVVRETDGRASQAEAAAEVTTYEFGVLVVGHLKVPYVWG